MSRTVSPARDIALDVLRRVSTQGAWAAAALRGALAAHPDLDERDRSLATELVYGVLRRRAQIDRAITTRGRRLKDLDPRLHDVLRLGGYQLLFLRVPAHAAVDEAVEQARERRGEAGARQVNAILRRLAAEPHVPDPPPLGRDPIGHVALVGSLSRSVAECLVSDLGPQGALDLACASLERAPLVLRANRLRTTREAVLAETGGEAGAHPWAVHLPESAGVLPVDLLAVSEGRATAQDEASMRVVDLLGPEPGERILDVCAAPGGKATCIAECMGDRGLIVAHDRATEKLPRVAQSAERLGLTSIRTAEVLPSGTFDRVIVDAPCSGLGTLRRHPEIRWRFQPEDVERLTAIQRKVLADGARRVRPGGVLIYSVCTVTRAESESIIASLEGFDLAEVVRTLPSEPGAPDAFFAAKLIKH